MKHLKTFESFINESKKMNKAEEKNALKIAKKLMNNSGYDTIEDAIEDMHAAIDYGVENEDELMDFIKTFESFINEAKIPDMSNVPLGAVTSYGEKVGTYKLGETGRGISTVSTLRLYKAEQIADALNKGGFEAEAIQLKGQYYDGYVEVKTPITYNDIKKMAGIIEDNLGHWLVNSKDERIRNKGRI